MSIQVERCFLLATPVWQALHLARLSRPVLAGRDLFLDPAVDSRILGIGSPNSSTCCPLKPNCERVRYGDIHGFCAVMISRQGAYWEVIDVGEAEK